MFWTLSQSLTKQLATIIPQLEKLVEKEVSFSVTTNPDKPHSVMATVHMREEIEWRPLATFTLSEFPGCCGICVSHGVSIVKSHQGKGIGNLLLPLRERAAFEAGYTRLMATTIRQNDREAHLLQKYGFVKMDAFTSQRTHNLIEMWSKTLVHTPKPFTVQEAHEPVAVGA